MALATALTMSCTCPLISLIAPSPTVTPTPTKTPKPTVVPTDTLTPTPEDTPTFTPMPVPSDTPTVAVTDTPTRTPVPPTATRRPPTSTPTRPRATATPRPPTATATPTYLFSLYKPIEYLPDCATTTLEGTVWDRDPPNQLGGVLLKVCIEGEYWCGPLQTGQDKTKGAGYYSGDLGQEGPRAGNWWVAVVDAEGKPLSQAVRFSTDTRDCEPGGTGHQWVIIDFKRNY
jgi:hypothetical protein